MLETSQSIASFSVYDVKARRDTFSEVIRSCQSLSNYENPSDLKTATPQIVTSIVAASFHILIGVSLAFSAILIPQVESETSDLKLTVNQSSWIASIIVMVVPPAFIMCGVLMESIGRQNTIKLAAIPCVIGWVLIAVSEDFYVLLFGRLLTGMAGAFGSSPAVVYITEVARPDLRASLLSLCPSFASLGIIIAYVEGAYLDWRLVAWLNIIYISICIIFLHFFMYESPNWLVSKGRIKEARTSLEYLYKAYPQPKCPLPSLAELHLTTLQREIKNQNSDGDEPKKKLSYWDSVKQDCVAFSRPTGYKPLILLLVLFTIQQFSGIYITLFYAVTFFQEVGGDLDASTCAIYVGLTRFVMSLTNLWLFKRFKRRHLIMTSTFGMTICMLVSGSFTYWFKSNIELNFIPVVFLLLYVCFSMIGLLSIPWSLTAELFPAEIRSMGHSISNAMGNLVMFFSIQSYRSLSDILGGAYAVQWMFAFVSMLGFFFALFILPETYGVKLSDIEKLFLSKKKSTKENSNDDPASGKLLETNIVQERPNKISLN